ncbi:MAG: hypothetical protein ACRDHP_09015, partial [Ktedonobacterales bacterium]
MSTEILSEPHLAERRTVSGRYRVRVDRLNDTGEACGRVVAILASPTDDDFALVYGERHRDAWPPSNLSFIGVIPDEFIDLDVT